MIRWLREPLLHFFVLGAAGSLLASAARAPEPSTAGREIVVSRGTIDGFRSAFESRMRRPPSPGETAELVERAIDEAVLVRRARELGLDRGSAFVRDRLIEVMKFLEPAESSDEAVFREAIALGLDESDVVIRRHLAERMRLLLGSTDASAAPPTDDALRALLEEERDRFEIPRRITLEHVFLSRDRRGERAGEDAERLLEGLRAGLVSAEEARRRGDPFLLGSRFVKHSAERLEAIFGEALPAAVARLDPGAWAGPFSSVFGEHVVRVEEVFAARLPDVDEVRGELVEAWRRARREEATREQLAKLRESYGIRVEATDGGVARRASTERDG